MKTLIVNWRTKEEGLGGQESYFSELSEILNAKIISHRIAENVINYNLFDDAFRITYQGYVIDKYLEKYEKLFKPDLIIKNSAIGGFINLKTPKIILFQDPFYSIFKMMIANKAFSNISEHYLACMHLQQWTAKQGKTVAVSNFMKKDMEDCGIKCDKVIEEGIDVEKFKPLNKEALKKAHNIPLDKKIGIAVTKFTSVKGWDILVKLINKFKDIHWIVVFTSEIGSKPKLKNVSLAEKVSPELMPLFYNCADFFINTSPIESFGLSACEAASCNLPIITYKTGFAWDWWDPRLGIRVDKWDYKSFEKAVKKISRDYEPRKAIIERGFTKKRMAKDWKKFIEKIIKK